jgi:hypothetical protein
MNRSGTLEIARTPRVGGRPPSLGKVGLCALALGLLPNFVAACSSSNDDEPVAVLRGEYVPVASNSTAAITLVAFDTDTRYRLRANGCVDASCEEHGSYIFDRANRSLALTMDGSGRSYSLPLVIQASRDARMLTSGSASTRTNVPLPGQLRLTSALTEPEREPLVQPVTLIIAPQILLDGVQYVSAGRERLGAAKPGKYDINDGRIIGSLTVTNPTPDSLPFDISIADQNYDDADVSGTARGSNGKFSYTSGGCKLELAVRDTTIDVRQEGFCGRRASVTGVYTLHVGDKHKLSGGVYEGVEIAVANGYVTGRVQEYGAAGAKCELTLAGKLATDQQSTPIAVTDGRNFYDGTLAIRDENAIAIALVPVPAGCGQTFDGSREGSPFKWSGLGDPSITAYRSVRAEKTYVAEVAGGPVTDDYLVNGNAVEIIGGNAEWPKIRYSPRNVASDTIGFVNGADLVALPP